MTSADDRSEPTSQETSAHAAGTAPVDGSTSPAGQPAGEGSATGNGASTGPADGQVTTGAEAEAGENLADDSPADLLDDLAQAQQQVADLTTDLQRLQAEYVNYKRRVDRDRQLIKENATYSAVSSLLPVLDDIDRAREHGELEGGFKAVADSLERVVSGLGMEKFGQAGDEFDPQLHEALMHAHSPDVTTTTCQHVVQAGYRIGDRVVRAAKVTVVDPEPAG